MTITTKVFDLSKFTKKQYSSNYFIKTTIANKLNCSFEKIDIIRDRFGKPKLESIPNKQNLYFNISHSNNLLIVALSEKYHIGVDIEYYKENRNFKKIAARFFSKCEIGLINNSKSTQQLNEFYRIWTKKEALLKGLGIGIRVKLSEICTVHINDKNNLIDNNSWKFYPLELDKNYIGHLAVNYKN